MTLESGDSAIIPWPATLRGGASYRLEPGPECDVIIPDLGVSTSSYYQNISYEGPSSILSG
jgi:hypothetical protein